MILNSFVLNRYPLNSLGVVIPIPILVVKPEIVGRRYVCVLTGANDAQEDVLLPISNLSLRMTLDLVSSLTVTVPDGVTYAQDIFLRPNGTIILKSNELYSDGTNGISDSDEYEISNITDYSGSRNHSVVLIGRATTVNDLPKKVKLNGVSFVSNTPNAAPRVRCNSDKDLLVGDIVILPDDSEFTVNSFVTTVSNTLSAMEVVGG